MPLATLPSKPHAPLAYDLSGSDSDSGSPLVVFINGLGLPAASWAPSIRIFRESSSTSQPQTQPQILTYDRYNQGATTAADPADALPGKDAGYGHDLRDVVADLHELLQTVAPPAALHNLVFVAASIGVHIARLYAAQHPGAVAGLLLLDSNVGNVELTAAWPDPAAPGFDADAVLPADCGLEAYREAYGKMAAMFGSGAKNGEGLDRRNVAALLPEPGRPRLRGPGGKGEERGPWVTVVGHEPEQFAEESVQILKIPRSVTMKFTQPLWHWYNEGLLGITEPERSRGVVFAPGCGHFIQKDNPGFVAEELEKLLAKVRGGS